MIFVLSSTARMVYYSVVSFDGNLPVVANIFGFSSAFDMERNKARIPNKGKSCPWSARLLFFRAACVNPIRGYRGFPVPQFRVVSRQSTTLDWTM